MMKYRDVVDFRLRGIAVAAMFDFLQFEKLAVCRLSGGNMRHHAKCNKNMSNGNA